MARSGRVGGLSSAPLAELASRQHGVLRVGDLRALGLSPSTVAKQRARGVLHRVYPGVYTVGHTALSREGRWLAAVFAAGDGAALSHRSAAALWNLQRWVPKVPHVIVARRHRPIAGVDLRVTRHLDRRDVTEHLGIPVTTVARVFVDVSDDLAADEVTRLISEAAYRSRLSVAATCAAMKRANGRRNLGVLEAALAAYMSGSAGVRSELETEFRSRLAEAGLPEPLVNVKVEGVEADFHWPELRLAIEIDGPGHARPTARRTDADRDRILAATGYTVLRFDDVECAVRAVADRTWPQRPVGSRSWTTSSS